MLTKQERQKIIDAHIRQYGSFEARHFADTVRADPKHPAHEWLCPPGWEAKAETHYLVTQVHTFISGLTLDVKVTVTPSKEVEVPTPSLVADLRKTYDPQSTRYVTPDAPNYMDTLDAQGEQRLREWAERYRAVIVNPKRRRQLKALIDAEARKWT